MAFTLDTLQRFCDRSKLTPCGSSGEVFLFDGVDPYQSEGISRQFLQDARIYHERYFKPTHFRMLLQRAFARAEFPIGTQSDLAVLDLGSGSGNTVIPLLDFNPSLKVIATDLSIDLLLILAELVRGHDYGQRLGFICADANGKTFYDGVFDAVIGSAILHHLMRPEAAVIHALASLKPGGLAVFFEPFEYGCNMMKNLYLLILDDPRCPAEIAPEVIAHFQATIKDFNARFDVGTVKPHTQWLDDKWLFTGQFFGEISRRSGCQLMGLFNNWEDSLEDVYTRQLLDSLKLTGLGEHKLPAWCLELCRDYDRSVALPLKRSLVLWGTALIRKPGQIAAAGRNAALGWTSSTSHTA